MIRLPTFKPFPPPRAWGAFLFTPAVSLYVAGVTLSFMFGRWSAATERDRVHFLGWALLASIALIYFGGNWLQSRGPLRWKARTPTLEIEVGNDPETPK